MEGDSLQQSVVRPGIELVYLPGRCPVLFHLLFCLKGHVQPVQAFLEVSPGVDRIIGSVNYEKPKVILFFRDLVHALEVGIQGRVAQLVDRGVIIAENSALVPPEGNPINQKIGIAFGPFIEGSIVLKVCQPA